VSQAPKYPRIPYVYSSPAVSGEDRVLATAERDRLLSADVLVEEKLDGMNVMLWVEDGAPRVGTRGGADTVDRSGERGRLRAWAAGRADQLADCLGDRFVVYGEWLRARHVVAYDRLPAYLVGFDVLDRTAGDFLETARRDVLLSGLGIPRPPTRFRGVLGSRDSLDAILGRSAFADVPAEGLVIRNLDGGPPRLAKHVDPSWHAAGETPWAGENHLAGRADERSPQGRPQRMGALGF
jgi:hypothetical protein